MRASKPEVPVADEGEGYEGRFAQWDGYTVSFETIPAGSDFAPLLKGLAHDACRCPHWGYCFKGAFVVRYTDGNEEIVRAGDAYYMRPGHRPVYVEESGALEFSRRRAVQEVMEVVARKMEGGRDVVPSAPATGGVLSAFGPLTLRLSLDPPIG